MSERLQAILLLQPHVGYPVHDAVHDHHELIVVVRNTYRCTAAGQAIELGPGDAVLYPAGCRHVVPRNYNSVTFFCIQWSDDHQLGRGPLVARDPTQRLVMAARWLHDLYHRIDRDHQSEHGLLDALIGEIRSLQDPETESADAIETVRRVLAHNYNRMQSTTNLATMAGLSTSQLKRSFQKRFGCTPMAYLRSVRIEAALAMLSARQASIAEIAEACGFNRSSYLVRVIREHTGKTPGQIRRGG